MPPKRLEDQLRDAIRQRGYSRRTEDSYVHWYKEYVFYHRLQHPAALGHAHLTAFLTHLAVDREVSASLGLALDRKYRRAAVAWEWQYLFPARDIAYDQRTQTLRRHHLHETGVQRAVSQAVKAAGIGKHATVHTFRAAFAHRLKESGCSLDDIRKLMGHADLRTTAHYLDGAPPPHTRWRGPLSEKS